MRERFPRTYSHCFLLIACFCFRFPVSFSRDTRHINDSFLNRFTLLTKPEISVKKSLLIQRKINLELFALVHNTNVRIFQRIRKLCGKMIHISKGVNINKLYSETRGRPRAKIARFAKTRRARGGQKKVPCSYLPKLVTVRRLNFHNLGKCTMILMYFIVKIHDAIPTG